MKKVTTILTAALMLFAVFAFASGKDPVNAKVRAAFAIDFSKASNISWEKSNEFYFATFTINNTEVNAAYSEDGELIGTARPIEFSQLPMSVSMVVNKKYAGYSFSKKVMELNYDGTTRYTFTAENEKQVLKLKCSVNGSIEVQQKIKKT